MKRSSDAESKLVYSSEEGRCCPECEKPIAACICRKKNANPGGDGIVRLGREKNGRGGKIVTTVSGIQFEEEKLKDLAGELKRRCGSGGTVKDGVIEIQGDHRGLLLAELQKRGFTVKKAGG